MQTTIGKTLADSSVERTRAAALGAVALGGDLLLAASYRYAMTTEAYWLRGQAHWALAMAALIALLLLARGDLASVGLVCKPRQGWVYWLRMTVVLGIAVLAILVVSARCWMLLGRELPMQITPPAAFGTRLLQMCIFAPLQEEVVYRMVLCVSFVGLLRPSGTILLSGVVFAALHVLYGVPSPENLVGGLFLAWSFLKSGTIVVPVLLHALGNFVVLLAQLAGWYLVQ